MNIRFFLLLCFSPPLSSFPVTAIYIINKHIIEQGFCHLEPVKLELCVDCGSNFTASVLNSTDGNLILQCQHPIHGSWTCGAENVTGLYNVSTDIFEIDFIYNQTLHGGQQYNISISCNDSSQATKILLKPCCKFYKTEQRYLYLTFLMFIY